MTESKETKHRTMGVRLPAEMHDTFFEKSEKYGMPASTILRELIVGFIEGRVTLNPPKHFSDLYNITKE